jgi:hypothetical protein
MQVSAGLGRVVCMGAAQFNNKNNNLVSHARLDVIMPDEIWSCTNYVHVSVAQHALFPTHYFCFGFTMSQHAPLWLFVI